MQAELIAQSLWIQRGIGLVGLVAFMALAWLLSSHRRRFPWRVVIGGLILQFAFAVIVFRTAPGAWLLDLIDLFFAQLNAAVREGSGFVFGIGGADPPEKETLLTTFAFGVLPTVIVFASIMGVLYHLGVMTWVVKGMAWVMQRTLGTSGSESLAAAANVFVGHTEAPLVVRPYIAGMTRSELNAMMIGGFATITGGLIAAFQGMGINASHLVTASVISAPAALLIAKIMLPETAKSQTLGHVQVAVDQQATNVLEAAAIGASDGIKLALNIGAMLIAFLALIALADAALGGLGNGIESVIERVANRDVVDFQWSLSGMLGYLFWIFAFLMGIDPQECLRAGELLGIKVVANEVVAYEGLSAWSKETGEGAVSDRTKLIMTYALAGFTNFSAIGIQIGGIGGMVPSRRSDLAKLGLRAMIGGILACSMTACIAGLLY